MTTTPLPTSYGWGKVIGRVVHAVADTAADADAYPEARPATGKVIFTPAKQMRKITDEDYPAFVLHEEVTVDLNEAGVIIDSSQRPGIWLIEGIWTVKFVIDKAQIPGFEIEVTRDFTDTAPLDLVMAAPPVPPPGATVVTAIIPTGGLPGQVLTPVAPGSTTLEWVDVDGTGGDGTGGDGVTDHGALTGLTDDDHQIYALADGTRGDFASTSHGHVLADISDYDAPDLSGLVQDTDLRLSDARAPLAHDHDVADVTGLQAALDGKQTAGSYATTAALDAGLADKADATHSHTLDDISDYTPPDLSGFAPAVQPINAQTTAYTLVASDAGKLVTLTNASPITLTVPPGLFVAGQRVDCSQRGDGAVTVIGGTGVTLNPMPGMTLVSEGKFAAWTVLFHSSTEADVIGWMAAA